MIVSGESVKHIAANYNRIRCKAGHAPYKGLVKLLKGQHGAVTAQIDYVEYTLMFRADNDWTPAPLIRR